MTKTATMMTRKMKTMKIEFPEFSGTRCLMMPYVQGDPDSIPDEYEAYRDIVANVYLVAGDLGFLTIDESPVLKGNPHRGARAKYERALHTEAGWRPFSGQYGWGGGGWGTAPLVTLEPGLQILLANNMDNTCAWWDAEHVHTSIDGDIGYAANQYPYEDAIFMKSGEVHQIGILTPHESVPAEQDFDRQFLRIIGSGVYGREPYFTKNPLMGD